MGGIFIGEAWCDKDYIKRVFARFPPETIEVGERNDGTEQWRLQLVRDGWVYRYEIAFGSDGLVRELRFSCEAVNLN